MTDETELRQDRSRGQEAERLLKSDLMQGAFSTIRANLHAKWEATKAEDREAREVFYTQLKCVNQVEEYFRQAIRSGKLANNKLEEIDNGNTKRTGPG